MHAFTLTLHTHLFGKELTDDELESIAIAYGELVEELMEIHALDKYFEINMSWRRGCLLVDIAYSALNPDIWVSAAKTAAAGVTAATAFFAAYPQAKIGFEEFKKDLRSKTIKKNGINVKARELYEAEAKPSKNSNVIQINHKKK